MLLHVAQFEGGISRDERKKLVFAFFTSPPQCDEIGRFFHFLGTNSLTTAGKIFGNFLGYFEKHHP